MKTIHQKAADNIRVLAAAMVEKAQSGHPGGAMGGADFINILFSEFLNYAPDNPNWIHRDRFFLDPGHMSPMLYGVLALSGYFSMDDLKEFRQWGSATPGHPEIDVARGIENTSGPLGQGHAMALGAAITERFLVARFGEWMAHKTYAFISDGGIQEEVSQGVGRLAGNLGLSNLIMFYDSNDIQLSTKVDVVTTEDTAKKYEAWGWEVISIDGNDENEIRSALKQAQNTKDKPTLIIGKTKIGKGCLTGDNESFEGQCATHGQPLSAAGVDVAKTIENLGGNPENPFTIFPEVKEFYAKRKEKLNSHVQKRISEEKAWEAQFPELAKKLASFFSGKTRDFDFSKIEQKDNQATRAASSVVLGAMAGEIENLIVSSADLSNSDKTDGFLKKSKAFTKGVFSGGFLQAGVSELTMACIMNGMALHGGVIPVCGTFFVFSDYMKPAVRLSALMGLPVIYLWTHDAFRVGEDGPTHQPIEHEAQIRLMEKLKNHKGENSMLVLRPADGAETNASWEMAMNNLTTPSALILSRQNIPNIPAENRHEEAFKAKMGGYIVKDCKGYPDVVLLASGSEVSTLVEGSSKLEKEGVAARVVSIPSEGLFRRQKLSYQHSVLSPDVPRFGLTAGLPVTLEGLVGENGTVWGLSSFGYSAPYMILDEKFGFTPENVFSHVNSMLASVKS